MNDLHMLIPFATKAVEAMMQSIEVARGKHIRNFSRTKYNHTLSVYQTIQ